MSKIYLLPISVFLIFQITFLGTYIAAVVQGHVVPTIPYISDAATYSPESCVFGQFINIGCVLPPPEVIWLLIKLYALEIFGFVILPLYTVGIVIYVRYRQIIEIYSKHDDIRRLTEKLNWFAVWIGIGSCLGISIVANFQETNVRLVHFSGAFLCFGLGTIYFWIEAVLSYYIQPYAGSMLKAHLRLGLSVMCVIFFIVIAVTGIISHILFDGQDPRKWYPSDGGWKYHVASSISEWLMATIFSFYILSFTDEFRDIHLDHPQLRIIEYQEIEYTRNIIEDNVPIIQNDEILS